MDIKNDNSAMQCVNCPGATDHSTAECPMRGAQPQASAAQSAPAGEREAFEHLWATRNSGDDGVIGDRPLRSLADPERYRGSAVNGSFVWFQRGAAWQRTQSAGVQEGLEPTYFWLDGEEGTYGSPQEWAESYFAYSGENPGSVLLSCAAELPDREYDNIEFDEDGNCISMRLVSIAAPAQPAAQDQGEVQRLREALDCDRAYRNGLQAGYSFGASGDEDGYQRSMAAYGREILSASTGQEVKP